MYTIVVVSRYRLLITILHHSDPRLRIYYLLSNLLPIIRTPKITPLYYQKQSCFFRPFLQLFTIVFSP